MTDHNTESALEHGRDYEKYPPTLVGDFAWQANRIVEDASSDTTRENLVDLLAKYLRNYGSETIPQQRWNDDYRRMETHDQPIIEAILEALSEWKFCQ